MVINYYFWLIILSSVVHAVRDVVFVVDKSASLSQEDFNAAVDFIYNVTSFVPIGTRNTQFSVVTFSSDVTERFDLNDHTTSTALLDAVDGLKSITTSGSTYTFDALSFVRTSSFDSSKGGRAHAEKTVILLTDGQSVDYSKTATEAQKLKNDLGAKVFTIGIGSAISSTNAELLNVSSDPDSYYNHHATSYHSLCSLVPTLVPKIDTSVSVSDIPGCPSDNLPASSPVDDNTVVIASVATASAVAGLGLTGFLATALAKKLRSKFAKVSPEEEANRPFTRHDNRRISQRAVFDINTLHDPSSKVVPDS